MFAEREFGQILLTGVHLANTVLRVCGEGKPKMGQQRVPNGKYQTANLDSAVADEFSFISKSESASRGREMSWLLMMRKGNKARQLKDIKKY